MAAEPDLEKEVDRIQKTAEKQLSSVRGLNLSLVRKIRASEAQVVTLLTENHQLEDKNAHLVAQLTRVQDDLRSLLLKAERLETAESQLSEAKAAVVATELAVKKGEARLDSLNSEKDALESEVVLLQRKVDTANKDIQELKDEAKKEKDSLNGIVQDRSLALESVTKERDATAENYVRAEENLKKRDADLDASAAALLLANKEKEDYVNKSEAALKEAQDKLEVLNLEVEQTTKDLAVITEDRQRVLDEKLELEDDVKSLYAAKEELELKAETAENDLANAKEGLLVLEQEKDDVQSELVAKVAEVDDLNAQLLSLSDERDQLNARRDQLEAELEDTNNAAEVSKKGLEEKNAAFASLEVEKNALSSEKEIVEKDYNGLRDKSAILEREKAALEMRVLDLEDIEKRLNINIQNLEGDKATLASTYQKELHDTIIQKDQAFALDHAALRQELDDVVDRYTRMRQEQLERDSKAVPIPLPVGASTTGTTNETTDNYGGGSTVQFSSLGDGTEQVEDLGDPMAYLPSEPAVRITPDGRYVMLDNIHDDDYKDPEMKETTGPGEGDTSIIASEVVMEELVVDERDGDDDVLEEVDEEVLVSEEVAAETRNIAIGAKIATEGAAEGATNETLNLGQKVTGVEAADGGAETANVVGGEVQNPFAGAGDAVKTGMTVSGEKGEEAGKTVEGAVEYGADTARDGAAVLGDATKDGAVAVGDATKEGAVAIGDAAKDGALRVGDTTKDAASKMSDKTKEGTACFGKTGKRVGLINLSRLKALCCVGGSAGDVDDAGVKTGVH